MVRKREPIKVKKNKRVINKREKYRNDPNIDNFDSEDGILEEDQLSEDNASEVEVNTKPQHKLAEKTKERLKAKITDWLNSDDKIKELNKRIKKI